MFGLHRFLRPNAGQLVRIYNCIQLILLLYVYYKAHTDFVITVFVVLPIKTEDRFAYRIYLILHLLLQARFPETCRSILPK